MTTAAPGSLEFWAEQRPDGAAIVQDGEILTFRTWNRWADELAEGLTRRGVAAGDVIATRMQTRKEWAVIASAAAKLGCSILGMDWRLSVGEAAYILSNSKTDVVMCDDHDPGTLAPAFGASPLKLAVTLDSAAQGFMRMADLVEADAPARFSRESAPLIIYTSGTTGRPKGVNVLTGAGTDPAERLEYLKSVANSRPQGGDEIVLVNLPMHHAAGPGMVRRTMAMGSTMVFQRRFDPEGTLELIQRHGITTWTGVPTMFKRIAGLPADILARYDVSSIRALGIGAAPAPIALKDWIVSFFGNCLHESYGATETGMITSLTPEMASLKPGSCGLPFKHVRIQIRDTEGRDLPVGETGDIWVKTPVTLTGYLNAGQLGPDLMRPDGFFNIGDVGRLDNDGFLFITDRAKDMIISGGVNIYPAEIEAALLQHAAVQDAAVVGVPDDEFGEQVKAFVELKPHKSVDCEELVAHCAAILASYKIPKSIDFVSDLPRNTMGKILKRTLREPFWAGRERKI